jgi:hypothetical protein
VALVLLEGTICSVCLRHAGAGSQNAWCAPRAWLPRCRWRLLLELGAGREPSPRIEHPEIGASTPTSATATASGVVEAAAAAVVEDLRLTVVEDVSVRKRRRARVRDASTAPVRGRATTSIRHDVVAAGP